MLRHAVSVEGRWCNTDAAALCTGRPDVRALILCGGISAKRLASTDDIIRLDVIRLK